jgi:hypothetical protein
VKLRDSRQIEKFCRYALSEISSHQGDNNQVLLNQSDKNDNNHLISFEIEVFDVF